MRFSFLAILLALVSARASLEARTTLLRRKLSETGSLDAAEWATLFVSVVVLVLIIAALFPVLTTALGDYATNETTFGPILVVVVPLVIGAAILLGIVAVFLGKAKAGM